jgi:iron complex outermembrane receptor protein
MKSKYLLIAIVLIIAIPIIVRCQDAKDSLKTFLLDPVVVTATQTEAFRSAVPTAVSVITKADIAGSGETSILPLISRYVPGAYVTERGVLGYGVSTGAAGSISIRGASGSPNTQVLVLTDGRPQMMGLMGHPLPDAYLSSGVERVEVIRGPASLLYGTNAMGGVVNIIYEKPNNPGAKINTGISYGSFQTQKYEVGGSYGMDGGGLTFSADRYQTDGHRDYSAFTSNNGALRGSMRLSDEYSANGDVSLTGFKTYDPGPASAPNINNWADITRGSAGVTVENHNGNIHGALKTFMNWGIHDLYDGFHSTDNTMGALIYEAIHPAPDNVTTFGVDAKRYGGKAEDWSSNYSYGEHFVQEYAAYCLVEQKLFDMMNLSAGMRLNNHSLFGWEAIPQTGLAFQASRTTNIKVSVSKGFRSPTIRELYLFPAPTPTLEPERMWNYEVSVLQNLNDAASIEVTGFLAEGSNIILTSGSYPNLVLSNSGSFTHRGIEVSAKTAFEPGMAFDATYTYLYAGEQTNANPKHKFYLGATYEHAPFRLNCGIQSVADLYGADRSKYLLSDYTLMNARVTMEISSGVSAYVAGENLLNRDYQILYDYPMPGRTIFVGANFLAR